MSAVSVAYEAPSRRMAFRVTAPAGVTIDGRQYRTKDWSTGGFSIDEYDGSAARDDRLAIGFVVDFQGFAVSFHSEARVIRRNGTQLAAEFIALGERELGLLRYFTSSLVSGQAVPVDGVLKSLDRPVTRISTDPPAGSPKAARRAVLRILIGTLYLAVGLAILASLFLVIVGSLTHINVDTAVTSAPLEQVVSADVGAIAEMNVTPGMQVAAGQPLFRIDSEIAVHNVQQAREELDRAQITLRQATARRADEEQKLAEYKAISGDQLAARKAQTVSAIAARDVAQKELERYEALWNAKVISRQLYDSVKARYDESAAKVEQVRAEENVAVTSSQSVNAQGHFFSGNYLVGEVNTAIEEERAAKAQVQVAEAALGAALQQQSKRLYAAPFAAVVAKVFKSRGMTVDRGEALVVLRKSGGEPYIDAYLTQEQAGQLVAGARATAVITATGKRYAVVVVTVDRTAGFLKDIQTPKLQEPAFQWRNIEDRSAYARLAFVNLGPEELASISPGLPVFVSVPRKRSFLPQWIITAQAASPETSPRLWPADSPLFTGAPIADARFEPVRRRVIQAAEAALQQPPAPVQTIHSAGVTDQSSADFQASRRGFQDADNFALMALAYRLTGRKQFEAAAGRVVAAWAQTNQPTGMPIDETRLDPFLWGLDLLGPEVRNAAVIAWLERWQSAVRHYQFGPVTATNNHATHHFKTLVMLDRILGREEEYAKDMVAVERQLKANLNSADGKSIDYEQRDAMHYHVFDLEAWLEIALVSKCCGESVDRAFQFFERTVAADPGHVEFARSTAAIDKKRAAAGFDYAKPHAFELSRAARLIFAYATLPGRQVNPALWKAANDGEKHDNLLYEARSFLWNPRH
jgi:multidrug resistance efflux pump